MTALDLYALIGPNTCSTGFELLVLAVFNRPACLRNFCFVKLSANLSSLIETTSLLVCCSNKSSYKESFLKLYTCDLRKDTYSVHAPVSTPVEHSTLLSEWVLLLRWSLCETEPVQESLTVAVLLAEKRGSWWQRQC